MDKNKIYCGKVIDFTVSGDGVVRIDGTYPVFVAGAVVGDEIDFKLTKINKTYGFGKIERIVVPSPFRCEPECKSFKGCGGCTLMHADYECQKEFKSKLVLGNIVRISGTEPESFEYEGIIGADSAFYYRNKAQFPVGKKGKSVVCGFYAPKSHDIIPCEECKIQNKVINSAVKTAMDVIRKNKITAYDEKTHKGIIRHIYARYGEENGELMVCIVTNSKRKLSCADELVKALEPLGLKSLVQNVNTSKTNVILGEENIVLCGNDSINIKIDDLTFKVNPHSFFQVNTAQMKKLYSKTLEYAGISSDDTVFDLYCGVGSISLYLAKKAKKVIGVEIVPQAIENAKENAVLSGIGNAEFYCGDCTEVVHRLIENGEKADVVVVDPPRKGCDENLLNLIEQISPRKVVYVSCNSSTLARDIEILKEKGYNLKKACAVDMFPNTCHVETVVLLSKLKSSKSVSIELDLDDLEITAAEAKATYGEIKEYILNKYGFKVSSLNIAQIKQ